VPNQVLFAFVVEFFMILLTSILLLQPRSMFRSSASWMTGIATTTGMVMLCLTFCWSVVLGAVLAMHGFTLRI
jgi:hypothetical protein